MKKANSKGFTLIEVMIVVAILAILAALAIPNFIAYRKTSHATACRENMQMITTACRTYQVNHGGDYTTDLKKLSPSDGSGLLPRGIVCPVNGEYTITYNDQTQDFEVTCSKANAEEHNVEQ